jgi:TatD DNase family protein
MMYLDVHCHLDFPALAGRIDEVIANAQKAGLKSIVTSGIDPASNRRALAVAEKYPIVRASIGLYPIDALQRETATATVVDIDAEITFIREHADSIVAIGEIGLDYKTGHDKQSQRELFLRLLSLAHELDKPVIIHSRAAEADALDVLGTYDELTVILHCFCGNTDLIRRAMAQGYSFSIPTNVVRSSHFQTLVRTVPLNQLFCETDAPFLSPVPGTVNEPANVVESYRTIAKQRGMTIEEVANIIYNNWQRAFQ